MMSNGDQRLNPFKWPVSVSGDHGLHCGGSDLAYLRTHILLRPKQERCFVKWRPKSEEHAGTISDLEWLVAELFFKHQTVQHIVTND